MTKKTPHLRFYGFTDYWEQRKLGHILGYEQPTKYIVQSTDYDNSFKIPVLTAGQSFILGYTNELEGVKKSTEENPVIIFDDFTTGSHYVDFPFKVKSSAMKLLDLKSDDNNFYFIYNILKNIKYTPQSHERHWISKFSEFMVYIPTLEEQKKIGGFFQQLDNIIALHQRKLELLKEQKKGFLQKMFPKNDEKVPELRFKGFTDDWEQRKLDDIVHFFNGQRIPMESSLRSEGQYPYYGATGIIDYVDDYIFDGEYVLLAEDGANITMRSSPITYITSGKFWLNNHAHIMKMIKGDNYFLLQLLERMNYEKYNTGTAQPKLNAQVIKNLNLILPTNEEQQKIGLFFKQLDETITIQERKLELLKEQKKAFLQKMFV